MYGYMLYLIPKWKIQCPAPQQEIVSPVAVHINNEAFKVEENKVPLVFFNFGSGAEI